jgi:hypothetical protein
MTSRIIVGIAGLACVSVCGVVSTLINLEMVDRVNEKLEATEKFDLLGW